MDSKKNRLKWFALLTASIALGGAVFEGCSAHEEKVGLTADQLCAIDAPCTEGQSCNNANDGDLYCDPGTGTMQPNPDVCGDGNPCTVPDNSWCCLEPTGDAYACGEAGVYVLAELASTHCACAVDFDLDGSNACLDCDDDNVAMYPGAAEVCDGLDNDCDGLVDEGVLITYCADTDGDNYGDNAMQQQACSPPMGYVVDCADCNDGNAAVNPGATEVCNPGGAVDDNCNGTMESDSPCGDGEIFCADDGCYLGGACVNPDEVCFDIEAQACMTPAWLRCCNGMFEVDAGSCGAPIDADGDGSFVPADCDDNNSAIYPGAPEVCDGLDNNCDGTIDEGFDGDADGYSTCATPTPDCDDANAAVSPGDPEVCGNGDDDDCDGAIDENFDMDMDGFTTCHSPTPDCDDNNIAINPSATEICDGVDNNCVGGVDEGNPGGGAACDGTDSDACNEGTITCTAGALSCDDMTGDSLEVCANGTDDDCDGSIDEGCVPPPMGCSGDPVPVGVLRVCYVADTNAAVGKVGPFSLWRTWDGQGPGFASCSDPIPGDSVLECDLPAPCGTTNLQFTVGNGTYWWADMSCDAGTGGGGETNGTVYLSTSTGSQAYTFVHNPSGDGDSSDCDEAAEWACDSLGDCSGEYMNGFVANVCATP